MRKRVNSKKEVRDMAKEVLKFLERERIKHIDDLERKVGKKSGIRNRRGHLITVEKRPSNKNTSAYTLSYGIHRQEIILEARLNCELGYTNIAIRGAFQLSGYTTLLYDGYGNVAQTKRVEGCSIEELKRNLELLAYNREQPHRKL